MKSAQLAAQVRISQPSVVERLLFGTSGLPVPKFTVSIGMCISILHFARMFSRQVGNLHEARMKNERSVPRSSKRCQGFSSHKSTRPKNQ
jgi:hypothetical protein